MAGEIFRLGADADEPPDSKSDPAAEAITVLHSSVGEGIRGRTIAVACDERSIGELVAAGRTLELPATPDSMHDRALQRADDVQDVSGVVGVGEIAANAELKASGKSQRKRQVCIAHDVAEPRERVVQGLETL